MGLFPSPCKKQIDITFCIVRGISHYLNNHHLYNLSNIDAHLACFHALINKTEMDVFVHSSL